MYVYMETGINSDLFNNRGQISTEDINNKSADPDNHRELIKRTKQLRVIFSEENLGTKDIPAKIFGEALPERIVPLG